MEVLEYIKSDMGLLREAIFGVENENGFTGIILAYNLEFLIQDGEVYRGSHPEDILDSNDLLLAVSRYKDQQIMYVDSPRFNFEFGEKKICHNYINDEFEFFYSNYNSEENVFTTNPISLIDTPTVENMKLVISRFMFRSRLTKIKNFLLIVEEINDESLTQKLNDMLDSVGLELKLKR